MVQTTIRVLQSTIREANSSLIKGESTVTKLCRESIRLLDEEDILNSFITICFQESVDKAKQLDEKLKDKNKNIHHVIDSGSSFTGPKQSEKTSPYRKHLDDPKTNPLFGIPISIKDNFCTSQILTTCGSKMLSDFVPNYTATAVTKLEQANCIIVGKTNMDEFAMGSSSTTSYFGPTANHWKRELLQRNKPINAKPENWYMAGGSSSGSATSVASGTCFASLGTDTGGSTRQPASLTGVVGFKPTYGLISRFGLVPLAHSLDVVSILARNVRDTKLIFDTVVGQDDKDLTSVDHVEKLRSVVGPKLARDNSHQTEAITIRVGIPEDFISRAEITSDVSNVFNRLLKDLPAIDMTAVDDSNGFIGSEHSQLSTSPAPSTVTNPSRVKFELIKLDLEFSRSATECYAILSSSEIASNMSCFDGVKFGYSTKLSKSQTDFDRDEFYRMNRDVGLGDEVKKRILLGNYFLLEHNKEKYLNHAMRLRNCISDEFRKAFEEKDVDVILVPSTPSNSVSHLEWLRKQKENKLFHEDYFLIPSNLANLPSISLPVALSQAGLPMGFQLMANKFHDLDLLYISEIFERIFRYQTN